MNLTGKERADYINRMFAQIARRYDLMNRLMTAWQDKKWRREMIRLASLTPHSHLLDVGTGTGDVAFEALRTCPGCKVTGVDFTAEMMFIGQSRAHANQAGEMPTWCRADALVLPFDTGVFDAVVSAFLLRNVINLQQALSEQWRVLKDGGQIVILDTTQPVQNFFTPLVQFHLRVVIPLIGRLITSQPEAYTYLPNSTNQFLTADNLAEQINLAGFKKVHFHRLMFETIAIHWAEK